MLNQPLRSDMFPAKALAAMLDVTGDNLEYRDEVLNQLNDMASDVIRESYLDCLRDRSPEIVGVAFNALAAQLDAAEAEAT
jgi:hypothetical protein